MMYKVKKYYPAGVDRRQMLESRYAQAHVVGSSVDQYKEQDFWPLLEASLKKDGRYVDVGCGVGGWILWLTEQGYTVAGVDEAAKVLRAMTEYNPDIEVKQAKLTALPYSDHSFDGVLSIGSLDHEEDDLPGALQEMKRVIKPGGLLFLEVPLLNIVRSIFYVPLKQIEALVRRSFGHHEVFAGYLFDGEEIKQLLARHGFEVVSMQPHDLPAPRGHYGLYVDWPFLRGSRSYQLNVLGQVVKAITQMISPWMIATGVFVVAKKTQ